MPAKKAKRVTAKSEPVRKRMWVVVGSHCGKGVMVGPFAHAILADAEAKFRNSPACLWKTVEVFEIPGSEGGK